jgi:hypothetical protein
MAKLSYECVQKWLLMILPVLQIAAIAVLAVFLARWRAGLRRRNAQSWESLIARLQPDWSARELSDHFLSKEGLHTTPEETWERIQGARGLRAMYRNAGVMLEMADYAARSSDSVDPELLAALRSDATQIRLGVLTALAQYAFNHASEQVRMNGFQVTSMYTGMAARMAQLFQENAAVLVPDFVAAM